MKIIITGGAGLVGSECVKLFNTYGWEVISIDNFTRSKFLGKEADTSKNAAILKKNFGVKTINMDFADDGIIKYIKKADAIIHNAAQPSYPASVNMPLRDFSINTARTLLLLDYVRKYNRDMPFVFSSTNKVYGEAPNYFSYKIVDKRFESEDMMLRDGFDEKLRTDAIMHTPFGVSKLAADMYVQEYARIYGLKTGVFRMGCITGGMSKASVFQNWIPFFMKNAITGDKMNVYGYKGYQVRDIIHAADLAKLYYYFILKPKAGEVYNVGGGRANSISVLEAIDLIEKITHNKLNYEIAPEREADHKWWITNINKVKSHYPQWGITWELKDIFDDVHQGLNK